MRDKRRGGLSGADPKIKEWQKRAATNVAALTAKQRRDRERVRVKYDMPRELKEKIEEAAKAEGTSASQFAVFLLDWIMNRWEAGEDQNEIGLRVWELMQEHKVPSRSMRFEWNLKRFE